jgi:hypothetical protein
VASTSPLARFAAQPFADPNRISWRVGGKGVALDWTSFNATARGGYGDFTAKIMPSRGGRVPARQGDVVLGKRADGSVVYEGKLIAPPKYIDDVGYFRAVGPRSVVDGYNDRLPYQIRDASQWQELHTDPANFGGNSARFQIAQKGNSIGIIVQGKQDYNVGNNQGYYLWVQGFDISNVQFTQRNPDANGNFDLRVRSSDDNFSAPSTENSFAMNSADSTARDVSFSGSSSVAIIDWNASSSASPTDNIRFWCVNARVGVITAEDIFTSAQVATDVAERCGYEAKSEGATNMMPLDWNTAATDLLNYLCDIEDQCWMVMHSQKKGTYGKLYFRDYGRKTWRTQLGAWADDQGLEIQPLFNAFTATYENPPGVQQSVRITTKDVGIPNPLPGQQSDYPDPIQIEDPQPSRELADAVATRALQKFTQLRVRGTVKVRQVGGGGVPFDIWPGDLLHLGDFQPHIPPQRIESATYNVDGSVDCDLDLNMNLAALVDAIAKRRLRRRPRRRR